MLHNIWGFLVAFVLTISFPLILAGGGFYLFYKLFLQPAAENAEESQST